MSLTLSVLSLTETLSNKSISATTNLLTEPSTDSGLDPTLDDSKLLLTIIMPKSKRKTPCRHYMNSQLDIHKL